MTIRVAICYVCLFISHVLLPLPLIPCDKAPGHWLVSFICFLLLLLLLLFSSPIDKACGQWLSCLYVGLFVCLFVCGGVSHCSAEELLQLLLHVGLGHRLVLLALPPPVSCTGRRRRAGPGGEPGVVQQLAGREALGRLAAQQAADQAAGLGREGLGEAEVAAADLGEERARLHIVEGVAAHQDGVEHDAQAPHVRRLARVAAAAVQDLGTHVRGAAVLV